MTRHEGGLRSYRWTLALVTGVCIVLGVFVVRAVRVVSGTRWTSVEQPAGMRGSGATIEAALKDSLLASANLTERDPFRPPPASRRDRPSTPRNPSTYPTETPVVRALLFDSENPTVQIGVGSQTSGWLHTGDRFQGWTVVEISPASVRIARNGESVVLPSS